MHCLEHLTTSTLFACDENYLDLNETKTKELIRDFRKACDHPKPGVIHAETIERMDSYKYSGTVFDSKLRFDKNRVHCQEGTTENPLDA